jgi:MoxR-like ATPase
MTNAFGNWTLTEVDGNEYAAPEDDDSVTSKIDKEMIGYADCEIPDDWSTYFDHLYGLDPHISRVRSAVDAAVRSSFRNRFNVVLVGPPGCGKSDVAESMRKALGEDAVMSFDATATTAAGLIKDLNDRDILPRVVVFEEIEKASEAAMQPLLGILDQRGEIRKTTARGSIQRDTKCLAIATVNDYKLFKRLQAGALASRFSNTVHFNRPSRETLSMILHREVAKVDGNSEWVKPALDYCEDHDIDDPREVIAFCLCGADDLLTGDYQKMMDATAEPQD